MKRQVLGYYVEIYDKTKDIYIYQSIKFKTLKQCKNHISKIDYLGDNYGVDIMILEGNNDDNYDINVYEKVR